MAKAKINYCPKTGKQMFEKRSQAEKVAYRTKKRLHSTQKGSVYLCEHCGKYHVTHYSYEASKEFRNMDRKRTLSFLFEYRDDTDLQSKWSQV